MRLSVIKKLEEIPREDLRKLSDSNDLAENVGHSSSIKANQAFHKRNPYFDNIVNTKNKTIYKNNQISKSFSTKELKRFSCEHCNYKATTNGNLDRHVKSIHDGVKYSCEHCDYKASDKGNLKTHVQSIHDGVKYKCEHCGYKATTKCSLVQHVKSIHDGVKYNCEHCDYKATWKSALKKHVQSIHDGVKFKCEHCA